MTVQWFKFAWLNLLRNRRRSAVTITIAALGSAAILLAGGFALFTYEGLAQASARTTGHLIVATPAQFDQEEDVPLQHGLDDVGALKARLLTDDAVRQVLPRIEFSGLISNGDKSTVMMAAGIDPDAEFAIKGPFLTIKSGQVLTSRSKLEVMLGEGLARSLKAGPGHSLTLLASTTEGALNALDVTVAATFSTGIPDLDRRLVYTDLATAHKLLATARVSSLGIFLDRMESTAPVQQRIKAALPDDTPLLPGMSVEANVVTREKADSLLIPSDAVQGSSVFVVEGQRVRRRNLELGIRGTRAIEVLSGLAANEQVASPAPTTLADGRHVRVIAKAAAVP